MLLAAHVLEDARARSRVSRNSNRFPNMRITDRVRLEGARLNLARGFSVRCPTHAEVTARSPGCRPVVRSAGQHHGYALLLGARYGEAAGRPTYALADLNEFGISFATPHLEWSLAAAELGLRHFAVATPYFDASNDSPNHSRDLHLADERACPSCARHLAQQRPHDALTCYHRRLSILNTERPSSPAMYGEYLATRARSAVLGENGRCGRRQAAAVTRAGDTRVLCQSARALVSLEDSRHTE